MHYIPPLSERVSVDIDRDPTTPSLLSSTSSPPPSSEASRLRMAADVIFPVQAIRKKIESELARKRTVSTTGVPFRQKRSAKQTAQKGTVAALRPSPALTVPENITVSEASQLCAAKRTDCVLVVDDEEGLSGIFTAKDLAYRVTDISRSAASALIPFSGHRRGLGSTHHPC